MIDPSIINVGELTKPATVLIERIADAVGGLTKPWQMKRIARAEAEVGKIRVQSEIDLTDLQRRALSRLLQEEAQKQQNIESITKLALQNVREDAKPQEIPTDWLINVFDKCRIVSDQDMQSLWSKILAGEANSPGSFSKRTVNFVSSLEKSEARTFTQVCTFLWHIWGKPRLVIFFDDASSKLLEQKGLAYEDFMHLQSIGMLQIATNDGFEIALLPPKITADYFGVETFVSLVPRAVSGEYAMEVGSVMLTQIGQELSTVCGATPDVNVEFETTKHWSKRGYQCNRTGTTYKT